jgi:hypothetical protein
MILNPLNSILLLSYGSEIYKKVEREIQRIVTVLEQKKLINKRILIEFYNLKNNQSLSDAPTKMLSNKYTRKAPMKKKRNDCISNRICPVGQVSFYNNEQFWNHLLVARQAKAIPLPTLSSGVG